jgi:hypothetical protein
MALTLPVNHWWQVTLYVSQGGLTTGAIPYGYSNFKIDFDLIDHALIFKISNGDRRQLFLHDGLSGSGFYKKLFSNLVDLGIKVEILGLPYDTGDEEPFETDTVHASYNKPYIERLWRILLGVSQIFKEFRGRFNGKSTAVHLFWHRFNLALTRFSGLRAPIRDGMGNVDRDAYSHEVSSFGFWAGDDSVPAPAFQSYTAPQPEGLTEGTLLPGASF